MRGKFALASYEFDYVTGPADNKDIDSATLCLAFLNCVTRPIRRGTWLRPLEFTVRDPKQVSQIIAVELQTRRLSPELQSHVVLAERS